MDETLRKQLDALVQQNDVVLFMKGSRVAPGCGFSARAIEALDTLLSEYTTVDVLEDPALRDGIKQYSSWPTIPQLYVRGEFLGGSDIVSEMLESGELARRLDLDPTATPAPEITLTPAAAEALRAALGNPASGGDQPGEAESVLLEITPAFENTLSLGPADPSAVSVEVLGVRLAMSKSTARRARGLVIDYLTTSGGGAFRLENPNEPPRVRAMSVRELKDRLDAGEPLAFFDVRHEGERALAEIEGARLLDEAAQDHIATLPRDTPLVFICHHGGRSHAAAQHFLGWGFTKVHNVVGGIDAWSLEIDPSVPRY